MFSYFFGSNVLHDSVPLPDYKLLAAASHFGRRELKRIYKRYCVVCRPDGYLDLSSFCRIPEVELYPYIIIAFIYESNESHGLINFSQFIKLLDSFSSKATFNEKIEYIKTILRQRSMSNDIKKSKMKKKKLFDVTASINDDAGNTDIEEVADEENTLISQNDYIQYLSSISNGSIPKFVFDQVKDDNLIVFPEPGAYDYKMNELLSPFDIQLLSMQY